MKKAVGSLMLALFVTAFPTLSYSQAVFGSISGTVTDSSGAALPSAKVSVTDVAKGVGYSQITNASGNYTQSHLITGIYEVRIDAQGFKSYVQKDVHVEVDTVTQVNAQLTVGGVGEVVEVNGQEPLLKTEKSDVSDTIEQKTLQEIPIYDRDVSRLYFFLFQAFNLAALPRPASNRRMCIGQE